jgi:competence protein ComEA
MRHLMLRGAALIAAMALLAAAPVGAAESPAGSGATSLSGVVNVNTANVEQLTLLPGVGPTRADAIIAYRKEHGAFKRPEDLMQVRGIGERAFEKLRSHVAISGKTTARMP